MTSTVLDTPLSIYEAARHQFDGLNATLISTTPIRMEIILRPDLPSIRLDRAVNERVFSESLQSLLRLSEVCALDITRFSVAQPLVDWQRFQRVMYEKDGRHCFDAIIDYLRDQTEMNFGTLTSLGLNPTQIGELATISDIAYFRATLDRLNDMSYLESQPIIANLKVEYPNVFAQIHSQSITSHPSQPRSNIHTLLTLAAIINTVANGMLKNRYLLKSNILIRTMSVLASVYTKNHKKLMLESLAIPLLIYVPKAWLLISVTDLIFEGISYYQSSFLPDKKSTDLALTNKSQLAIPKKSLMLPNRLDPTNLINAYKILNIPEDQRAERVFIKNRYEKLGVMLATRKSKVSDVFGSAIQLLIEDLDIAYTTVFAHLNTVSMTTS